MTDFERHSLTTGVWEVTTERGTRQILDLDEGIWMRLPGEASFNPYRTDHQWQRLLHFASGQYGADAFGEVWLGRPLRIWISRSEWWTTTWVQSVRELREEEVPPPSPLYMMALTSYANPTVVDTYVIQGGDIPASGAGPSIDEAIDDYAAGLEEWLATEGVCDASRLARRYASYADDQGLLRPFVEVALVDEIERIQRNLEER